MKRPRLPGCSSPSRSAAAVESGRVVGHRTLGMVLFGQAKAREALEHFECSMRLYVPERDAATTHLFGQNTEVHTKSNLSLALFCLGDVDRALAIGVDALRSADALRHPHSTMIPLAYVAGWVFGLCGAADPMLHEAKRMLALAEQHQFAFFRPIGLANLGWAKCQRGDLREGAGALSESVALLDRLEFRLSVAGYLGLLAEARRRLGEWDAAKAACERALDLMSASSFLWLEPELRRIAALITAQSEPARGERMLREAVGCAQALGFPVLERRCLLSLDRTIGPDRRDRDVAARLQALSPSAEIFEREWRWRCEPESACAAA